jgi:hypothetical protein
MPTGVRSNAHASSRMSQGKPYGDEDDDHRIERGG